MGGKSLPISLTDPELDRIAGIVLSDFGEPYHKLPEGKGYFDLPIEWFVHSDADSDFVETFLRGVRSVPHFESYFLCLCELHKHRKKYRLILSHQPMPTTAQIAPRSILEFGLIDAHALASWIVWRKWFYDIDNRVAQGTGQLFERILAVALQGKPYITPPAAIPRRANPAQKRQVDCLVEQTAYEIKLRVTNAASNKGRSAEEASFAHDCAAAGYRPMLLVIDSTDSESESLAKLREVYGQAGGDVLKGSDVWNHVRRYTSVAMIRFIDRYVSEPIAEIDAHATDLLDFAIRRVSGAAFQIRFGSDSANYEWHIERREDQGLADDAEAEDEG